MQSTDGDGDGDGKADADNDDEADADNDDDAEMIYNIFPPKVLGVSRSTSRGDFMASRKILLLPPNISSTKYFIPSFDQIYLAPNSFSLPLTKYLMRFCASKYLIFMTLAKL